MKIYTVIDNSEQFNPVIVGAYVNEQKALEIAWKYSESERVQRVLVEVVKPSLMRAV